MGYFPQAPITTNLEHSTFHTASPTTTGRHATVTPRGGKAYLGVCAWALSCCGTLQLRPCATRVVMPVTCCLPLLPLELVYGRPDLVESSSGRRLFLSFHRLFESFIKGRANS
jgi:hypothetical protein